MTGRSSKLTGSRSKVTVICESSSHIPGSISHITKSTSHITESTSHISIKADLNCFAIHKSLVVIIIVIVIVIVKGGLFNCFVSFFGFRRSPPKLLSRFSRSWCHMKGLNEISKN